MQIFITLISALKDGCQQPFEQMQKFMDCFYQMRQFYQRDKYNYRLILLMRQRQRQYSRSPYLSASKAKDSTFFPKIHKADLLDRPNFMQKSPIKSPYSNYKDERLRKKQGIIEMSQKGVQVNPQRISESNEYRALMQQIQKLQRQSKQEIEQIQQRKAKVEKKIKEEQGGCYKAKYSIWEIKNQIMDLEALLREEQQLLDSCSYRLGFRPAEVTGQPDSSQNEGNQ